MKFKILAVIVVLIGAIVSFALKKEKVEVKASPPSVEMKKPIEVREKMAVKIEHAPTIAEKQSSSLAELKGPIHNQYGIRDDILKYIEDTIPHWNKKAWMAAIAIAREDQFLYYVAKTDAEAFKSTNRALIAIKCLKKEYPENNKYYDIFKKLERLMEDTPERKSHKWEVIHNFFSGKHYDYTHLTKEQLQEKCESGDY